MGKEDDLRAKDLVRAKEITPRPYCGRGLVESIVWRSWWRPAGCSEKLWKKVGVEDPFAAPPELQKPERRGVYVAGRFVRIDQADKAAEAKPLAPKGVGKPAPKPKPAEDGEKKPALSPPKATHSKDPKRQAPNPLFKAREKAPAARGPREVDPNLDRTPPIVNNGPPSARIAAPPTSAPAAGRRAPPKPLAREIPDDIDRTPPIVANNDAGGGRRKPTMVSAEERQAQIAAIAAARTTSVAPKAKPGAPPTGWRASANKHNADRWAEHEARMKALADAQRRALAASPPTAAASQGSPGKASPVAANPTSGASATGGGERPAAPRPASPQPASPQPARPQPASPQPARPQPASPQPARPLPASPQPASPQPARPQPASPQPARPQPASPQPARPQPAAPSRPAASALDGPARPAAPTGPVATTKSGVALTEGTVVAGLTTAAPPPVGYIANTLGPAQVVPRRRAPTADTPLPGESAANPGPAAPRPAPTPGKGADGLFGGAAQEGRLRIARAKKPDGT